MDLSAVRAAMRSAIKKFDQAAEDGSNDAEHEAAAELRDAAATLVDELLAAHDPDHLLSRVRNLADQMAVAPDSADYAEAATAMRQAFLDLDDFLAAGHPPPGSWLTAWPSAALS